MLFFWFCVFCEGNRNKSLLKVETSWNCLIAGWVISIFLFYFAFQVHCLASTSIFHGIPNWDSLVWNYSDWQSNCLWIGWMSKTIPPLPGRSPTRFICRIGTWIPYSNCFTSYGIYQPTMHVSFLSLHLLRYNVHLIWLVVSINEMTDMPRIAVVGGVDFQIIPIERGAASECITNIHPTMPHLLYIVSLVMFCTSCPAHITHIQFSTNWLLLLPLLFSLFSPQPAWSHRFDNQFCYLWPDNVPVVLLLHVGCMGAAFGTMKLARSLWCLRCGSMWCGRRRGWSNAVGY